MNPGTQQQVGRSDPGRLDGLWVGLFFLLVYEILRQRSVYGDGIWILNYGRQNVISSEVHFLYLPLLRGLRWLLEPLGLSVFQITSHLSCVAVAIGVGLSHKAFTVLQLTRGDAVLAAALVGFTPGVVFYASVVEWQPLFFGFAGLAFVAAARLAVGPTAWRAVLLGFSTGVAYLAHASGLILPLPLLLLVWAFVLRRAEERSSMRRLLALSAATLLAHAVIVWGIPLLLWSLTDSVTTSVAHAQSMFSDYAETDRWSSFEAVLGTVTNEWFVAFAPMSVAGVLAFFLEGTRLSAFGLGICLVPYLTVSAAMLAGHNEYGAYLLPLAFPAAWITVRCYSWRVTALWVLVAAVLAVVLVKLNDEPERNRAYAEGLRQTAGGEPMAVLIGDYLDLEACVVRLPEVPYVHLTEIAQFDRARVESLLPQLDGLVDRWLDEGRRVFLTDRVEEVVRAQSFAGYETLDRVILRHLREEYELTPVESGTFGGEELSRR